VRQAHRAARDPTGWAIDRIAELEARVAWLEAQMGLSVEATDVEALRRSLSLTIYQARFLLLLHVVRPRVLRPHQIVNSLGSKGARMADASLCGLMAARIRKRAGPGLLHCARGLGWAISPAGAAKVDDIIEPMRRAA
jgi:hypothetical protein